MATSSSLNRAYGITGFVDVFPQPFVSTRAPVTGTDSGLLGQAWVDTTNDDIYFLVDKTTKLWINSGGGAGTFATLLVTGAVTFSGLGLGVVQSSATGVLSSSDGTDGQLLIAATGAAAPAWANIVSGDGSVVIANGAGSIDLRVSGAAASTFPTDAGTATPALGATTIAGGTNVNTSGAAATVTINVDNAPIFSGLVTGQAGLTVSAGTTTITSDTDAAQAIYLHADGGVNETIQLHADQGTGVTSLNLLSDVGGITLQSAGLASDDAINIEADLGGVDIDAALQLNLTSSEAAADAVRINASNAAGGIDVDSGTAGTALDSTGAISLDAAAASNFSTSGAGIDLTLASAAGRVIVNGDEAADNAVTLLSTAGGIDADCVLQMNLASSEAAVDAIRINASNAAGGIDVDDGGGGMTFDSLGAISIDGAANSNVSVSGAGIDLTLASAAGRVIVNGEEAAANAITLLSAAGGIDADCALQMNLASSQAAADAIRINASNAAGGIDVDDGGGGMTFDSLAAISLDAAAASNFSVSGAGIDLTLASAAGRVVVNGEEAAANAVTLVSAAGGIDADCALQMNLASSQAAADAIRINASNAAGGIDVDDGGGGMTFDSLAGISLDAATASNFTTSGAGADLTLQATAGRLILNAGEDAPLAIHLHANAGTSETIEIHSNQGTGDATIQILADAGGVQIDGNTGNIKLVPGTNSAAGLTVVLNKKIGVATYTGNTTAAGAQETFILTNSEISAGSGMIVTVANEGGNDARMTLERVDTGAGTVSIQCQNNGGAALNGDVIISYIVLN